MRWLVTSLLLLALGSTHPLCILHTPKHISHSLERHLWEVRHHISHRRMAACVQAGRKYGIVPIGHACHGVSFHKAGVQCIGGVHASREHAEIRACCVFISLTGISSVPVWRLKGHPPGRRRKSCLLPTRAQACISGPPAGRDHLVPL